MEDISNKIYATLAAIGDRGTQNFSCNKTDYTKIVSLNAFKSMKENQKKKCVVNTDYGLLHPHIVCATYIK